jgi:uncharacterized protein (TIGR02001 family)
MKAHMKKTLVSSAVTGALLVGTAGFGTAQAELEFNVGAFTDYILWGASASDNNAVVQGGIDYGHESGFYLGTWVSTLGDGAGQEVDLYGGYVFAAGEFEIDLGYLYYYYPALDDADYGDLFAQASYGPLYASVNYALHAQNSDYEGSMVYKLGGDVEVMPSISLNGEFGYTDQQGINDGADVDWTFWSLGLTKSTNMGDISLTYAQNDEGQVIGDDPLFVVGYSISF